MKTILITDTHFGVKQNSTTWLNSQLNILYNQILPLIKKIKEKESVRIIHCGDVFDSRNTINTLTAIKVSEAFKILAKECPIYIVLGNHDFYSPNDSTISTLNLVFDKEENIHLIQNTIEVLLNEHDEPEDLLVPWYQFDDAELLSKHVKEFKPKRIFCHTDLLNLSDEYKVLLKDIKLYSGHIHTPYFKDNLFNLGSTYALNFADANAKRGFYVLDNISNELKFIESKDIILFYRFYNDEIFNINPNILAKHYVECYIDKSNLIIDAYIDRINELSKKIKNFTIIPNIQVSESIENIEFKNFNILDFCKTCIPEYLLSKFNLITTN